jgi:ABC-2 type transport system permease protein
VLATAVSRTRWALSHLTIAAGGAALLLIVGGLAAGISHATQTGDAAQVGRVLAGALVQLPAVGVLTGIVVAAFGLAPRWTAAGWAALVGFLLLGEVGPLLRLRQWMMDLSPYAHVPRLPGTQVTATPLVVLLSVAAALMVAGLVGFRRRDVTS